MRASASALGATARHLWPRRAMPSPTRWRSWNPTSRIRYIDPDMDAGSEARLRELRLNLAEICLEGRVERIASLCRNPSGDALMTMINSGVRHLPMAKSDQAVAERCHRILSVEHDVGRKVSAYLALN